MKRPFAVTLLALGAFLIGFLNLLVAMQAFGVAVFGTPFNVLGSPLWASLMYGLVGVIWISVGGWLWRLQPSGWLFVVVIAIFNLILYFMSWVGGNQAVPDHGQPSHHHRVDPGPAAGHAQGVRPEVVEFRPGIGHNKGIANGSGVISAPVPLFVPDENPAQWSGEQIDNSQEWCYPVRQFQGERPGSGACR